MSLLVLFMMVGEAKFAVRSCTEPAENSKNLKPWFGLRTHPSAATASPAIWRGVKKKKKEGKSPSWLPECLFFICMNTSICFSGQRR